MQEIRGEGTHGGEPGGSAGALGTAEPVTFVDLDGAVTRIAPFGAWTREQVRHPGDDPLFITRLERGQLWHRAGRSKTWAHEVQVGPATVVSEGGRFHVVAEPDGGATITCLDGNVAVATQLSSALLLQRDEAVSVDADGETCVMVEPAATKAAEPRAADPSQWSPTQRDDRAPAPNRVWVAVASRPYVVAALLALVAVLLIVLIALLVVDHGGSRTAPVGPARSHQSAIDAGHSAIRPVR